MARARPFVRQFQKERIDYLRLVYRKSGIDGILHDMYDDNFWYEKPIRRSNVLYMHKNLYDPDD